MNVLDVLGGKNDADFFKEYLSYAYRLWDICYLPIDKYTREYNMDSNLLEFIDCHWYLPFRDRKVMRLSA